MPEPNQYNDTSSRPISDETQTGDHQEDTVSQREKLESAISSVNEILSRYRYALSVRDQKITFIAGRKFHVDAVSRTITLDALHLIQEGNTPEQILWLALSMSVQLSDYLYDQDVSRNRLATERRAGIFKKALTEIRETLDVVYKHKEAGNRVVPFRQGEGGYDTSVKPLLEKRFHHGKLRDLPRYQQIIKAMAYVAIFPDAHIDVDDEVREILNKKENAFGLKQKTLSELLRAMYTPTRKNPAHLSQRLLLLENKIEPLLKPFLEEAYKNGGKGEMDPNDMPDQDEEYIPKDVEMIESEGVDDGRYLFKISPGKTGFHVYGCADTFNPQTKRWTHDRNFTAYTATLEDAPHRFSGKVVGKVAVPLPPGYAIDTSSIQHSDLTPVSFSRDQYGHFVMVSEKLQDISFDIGKDAVSDFLHDDSHTNAALAPIYEGSLSDDTEAAIERIEALPNDLAKVKALLAYMKRRFTYELGHQGRLVSEARDGNHYFQLIDGAPAIECYTANTFFVALCRRVGVPARTVLGFVVKNTDKNLSARIKKEQGHCTSEVWINDMWMEADATPQKEPGDDSSQEGEQLDTQQLEEWMEQEKIRAEQEKEKEAEKNKTLAQRQKELRDSEDEKLTEEFDLASETVRRYREVEESVRPFVTELSKLWDRLLGSIAGKRKVVIKPRKRSGDSHDIPAVIEHFAELQSGSAATMPPEIFNRPVREAESPHYPEMIRIRFIGDVSGSMDAGKMDVLEKVYVLLMASLQEFQSRLNLNRERLGSKLFVDTQVHVFGSDSEEIKHFRGQVSHQKDMAHIIKAFEQLRFSRGGTNSDLPYTAILENLSPQEKSDIQSGKCMEIVFEMTDGGSQTPEAARKHITQLASLGVIVRGFLIGQISPTDEQTFQEIFNAPGHSGEPSARGEIIGPEIENIVPAITDALQEHLRDIII